MTIKKKDTIEYDKYRPETISNNFFYLLRVSMDHKEELISTELMVKVISEICSLYSDGLVDDKWPTGPGSQPLYNDYLE